MLHIDAWMKLVKIGSLSPCLLPHPRCLVFRMRKEMEGERERLWGGLLPVLRLRKNLLSVSFIIICTIIILILIIP